MFKINTNVIICILKKYKIPLLPEVFRPICCKKKKEFENIFQKIRFEYLLENLSGAAE